MKTDLPRLLADKGVKPVADTNARGWLTLDCPWCGRPYLGWQQDSGVFHCWNCRGHAFGETLARILRVSVAQALAEASKYSLVGRVGRTRRGLKAESGCLPEARLPDGCGVISGAQYTYLTRRGFEDVDRLIETWDLRGIVPWGGRLANRILIPVKLGGRIVSWTARTIHKEASLRYVSCSACDEAMPIKDTVFGWDNVQSSAVVVEGPFDAMKMGPGAVATMGTAWTTAQLRLLSGLRRVAILYDSEPAAQRNALALAVALSTMGVESEVVTLDDGSKDPGDLSERDAGALRRELIGS